MKNLIVLVTFLVNATTFAGDHCDINGVYFKHKVNGAVSDHFDFVLKFNKKGSKALESRNYHYPSDSGHKSLIVESDCKEGEGFYLSACAVTAKIYCEKEQKVEAVSYRYAASASELNLDKMAARVMLRAIKGLPKCQEHD